MDFFKITQKMNAKSYTECVAALQGAKMFFKSDTLLGGYKIVAFSPKKNDQNAIVKTSQNFRAAAKAVYPDLMEDQRTFIRSTLMDFMEHGLSMPVLGKLEVCSEEEKAEIIGIIGNNQK